MCGIVGFIEFGATDECNSALTIRRMCDALAHRGPDGDGLHVEDRGRIAIGHKRLSIIDLSPRGAQPMTSSSGRYIITYNGEIYGFDSLREELAAKGHVFYGGSDTEVLLAAIEEWTLPEALKRIRGMFAFALLDRSRRELTLARDRLGQKPLYYGLQGTTLAFASELKALLFHHAFASPVLDQEALALYVQYGYVPAPHSIYRGVVKLAAGSSVTFGLDESLPSIQNVIGTSRPYWDLNEIAVNGYSCQFTDTDAAMREINLELLRATEERMVADVPVGAFLSGGIDSTLITALMQEVSSSPVRTYCIRFSEHANNEADFAAAVAAHLGTQHTEFKATPELSLKLFDKLPDVFDEPFADPSQIPTMMVSSLTREDVIVALTGDGGDESFGGYLHYPRMLSIERLDRRMPAFLPRVVAASPLRLLDTAARVGARFLPIAKLEGISADRIVKLMHVLDKSTFRERYDAYRSLWKASADILLRVTSPSSVYRDASLPESFGPVEQMMLLDTMGYLTDDVLVKVDRASMAFGLEVRSPFVDHRVIETAWRLPISLRFDGVRGKIALRHMLNSRFPTTLFERPKQGFGIPVNDWLRNELRTRCNELLSRETSLSIGVFDPDAVEKVWEEHLSRKRNWGARIWAIIMFNLWYQRWKPSLA